jgi:hypothetical protein
MSEEDDRTLDRNCGHSCRAGSVTPHGARLVRWRSRCHERLLPLCVEAFGRVPMRSDYAYENDSR